MLFRDLPTALIEEHPIEEDTVPLATVNRIWNATKRACRLENTISRRRLLWLIPLIAVLTACAILTVAALSAYHYTPSRSVFTPAITWESFNPAVSEYEDANDVHIVAEQDGARVILDKYTLDTVSGSMRFLITIETTDGTALTELTAERQSNLGLFDFDSAFLTQVGANRPLGCFVNCIRTDNAESPYSATFEVDCTFHSGNGSDWIGKDFTLQLTDYVDAVRLTKDLSFTYPSLEALYNDMTPADKTHIRTTNEYPTLPATRQKIVFSLKMPDVTIDNIAFYTDQSGEERLCISYNGLSGQDEWPLLIDTRTGLVYSALLFSNAHFEQTAWIKAKNMGITDGERVTLSYNVTRDMLPYLFMMQEDHQYYDYVTRVEGVWELPFSVTESTVLPVKTFDANADYTFYQFRAHLSSISLTDNAVYFEASYDVIELPEGETTADSLRGTIDLVMADGTVIENAGSLIADFGSYPAQSVTCRFGGALRDFYDSSQIVAIVLEGQTIPITSV